MLLYLFYSQIDSSSSRVRANIVVGFQIRRKIRIQNLYIMLCIRAVDEYVYVLSQMGCVEYLVKKEQEDEKEWYCLHLESNNMQLRVVCMLECIKYATQ